MSDFLTVDENLRTAMRFFGGATGSGDVTSLPGTLAIFSGLDYGVFNIALLEERVTETAGRNADGLATGGLEARLIAAARFFQQRTLRWSFWLCEDMLDAQARRRARQTLVDFGLRAISHPPGMLARNLLPPIRPLPRIECRPVSDASTRQAFAEITSITFEIPPVVTHAVYTPERAWKGAYQGFVGLVDGRPIAIVAIVAAGGALGVYSLGTLPLYRRHGYGEALLRAAVSDVYRKTGIECLVLQSTDAGYELYRRLGLRDATRYGVFLTR
jgi:ribosomal protein S18 acetylase RimI-like enzyme